MGEEQRYFVMRDGEKMGPFNRQELEDLWLGKSLPGETVLKEEKTGASLPLGSLFVPPAAEIPAGGSQPGSLNEKSDPVPAGDAREAAALEQNPVTAHIGSVRTRTFESVAYMLILVVFFVFVKFYELRFTAPYLLAGAGILFITDFYFYWKTARLIMDTPTSKARSAAVGQVEMAGEVRSLKNLCGPYSGVPCVICEYKREEKDYRGRRRTVSSGTLSAPFMLVDGTGEILVDPDRAQVSFVREGAVRSWGAWDFHTEFSPGVYVYERWIVAGETVYILGRADAVSEGGGEEHFMIHKGDAGEQFMIMRGKENTVLKRLKSKCFRAACFGIFCLAAAVFCYAG